MRIDTVILCLVAATAAAADYGMDPLDTSGMAKEEAAEVFSQREVDESRWLLDHLARSAPGTVSGQPVESLRLCPCVVSDPDSADDIRAAIESRIGHREAFTPLEQQGLLAIAQAMPEWRQHAPLSMTVLAIEVGLRGLRDGDDVATLEALAQRRHLAEAIHIGLGEAEAFALSHTGKRFEARAAALLAAGTLTSDAPAATAPAASF